MTKVWLITRIWPCANLGAADLPGFPANAPVLWRIPLLQGATSRSCRFCPLRSAQQPTSPHQDWRRAENLPHNDHIDHRVFVDITVRAATPFSRLRRGNLPVRGRNRHRGRHDHGDGNILALPTFFAGPGCWVGRAVHVAPDAPVQASVLLPEFAARGDMGYRRSKRSGEPYDAFYYAMIMVDTTIIVTGVSDDDTAQSRPDYAP